MSAVAELLFNRLISLEIAAFIIVYALCMCAPMQNIRLPVFSERELTFTFPISSSIRPSVVCLSVCLSVCRMSVTFVRPTQAIEIFGNVSTPFGTLVIHNLSVKFC